MTDVEPRRYKELARHRDVIQNANRKFLWSAVYNYDVQFRLGLTLNTSARFDTVDTTLYTTILDSSTFRKDGISCQRCKSPNHRRWRKNQSEKRSRTRPDSGQQANNWKFEKWFTGHGKEGCNLFQPNSCQQGTECAHVCKACRGSTLWKIVNTLPDFNSSFKTDTWTDCSSRYRDQTLANDLLHDICFGVNIGFSGNHDSQIYENHFLAKTNPEAVAKELERELTLNRKIGPFLTSDRQLKSTQYLRNAASSAIYPGPSLTLLTMVFPKNCFVVPTTPLTRRSRNLNSQDKVH